MSWNKEEEDNKSRESSGAGLAAGLLLAGGAAAAGFALYKLFSNNKPEPPQPPQQPRRESWTNFDRGGLAEEVRSVTQRNNITRGPVSAQWQTPYDGQCCLRCERNPREVKFEPCSHLFCENCAEDINDNCPICGRNVTQMKPRYL